MTGDLSARVAFVFFSGLSANGAHAQRIMARELYRRFERRFDVSHRNLWGHTGRYGDFRQSRMWNWFKDAISSARSLTRTRDNEEFFLIGHSTGALIVILLTCVMQIIPWSFRRKHRHAQVSGVILCAPAFKLCNKRDSALLTMVLCLYYMICPVLFLAIVYLNPRLWDLVLLTAACFYILLPRIRVPTGESLLNCSEEERPALKRKCRRDQLSALGMVLYFGIFPIVLFLLDLAQPIYSVRISIWFFFATILFALWYLPKGEVLDATWDEDLFEERRSRGYRWLPVVTAATLIPTQWLSRYAIRWLHCPVLVLLAGNDRIVDNRETIELFKFIPSEDKHLEILPGHLHANLDGTQQLELVDWFEKWSRQRLHDVEIAVSAPPAVPLGKFRSRRIPTVTEAP